MTDFTSLTVAQLKEELTNRGLDTSGLKAVLLTRLQEADAAQAQPGAPEGGEAAAAVEENQKEESGAAEEAPAAAAAAAEEAPVAAPPVDNGEPKVPQKLFVGQVPKTIFENELKPYFEVHGPIREVVIHRDKFTSEHRGCAFVTYEDKNDADKAIEALNDKLQLPGGNRELKVRIAGQRLPGDSGGPPVAGANEHGEYKLYVGMLWRQSTVEDVEKLFNQYGVVKEVYLMRNKDQTNSSKGCGFVKYTSREDANRAIQALNGKYTDGEAPSPIQVRFAHTRAEKQQQRMGSGWGGGGGYGGGFGGQGA